MSWRTGTIGDLVVLQRGHDLTENDRTPGDIPVVGAAGPTGYHNQARVSGPGVAIGRSGGSIGKVTYVPCDYWPHNTCIYVKDFKGNNPRFVACLLSTLNLAQLNSGAAQPSLNRNFVYPVRVKYPEPTIQVKIAAVLSAYDDLIDNNRRRIQFLEQAARLLYREWFVHLRFPGHEHAQIEKGVPEGWEKQPLGDVSPLKYGKALKEDDRIPGEYPVYGSSGIVGTHEKALVTGPAIVVGRKGNVGTVYWSTVDFHPIDTVYYIERENCSLLLFYQLLHAQFISTDVAVPGLNRDFAHSRKLLIPDKTIRMLFEDIAMPIHEQIDCLQKYNAALSSARDFLLPRLMNGEIAV